MNTTSFIKSSTIALILIAIGFVFSILFDTCKSKVPSVYEGKSIDDMSDNELRKELLYNLRIVLAGKQRNELIRISKLEDPITKAEKDIKINSFDDYMEELGVAEEDYSRSILMSYSDIHASIDKLNKSSLGGQIRDYDLNLEFGFNSNDGQYQKILKEFEDHDPQYFEDEIRDNKQQFITDNLENRMSIVVHITHKDTLLSNLTHSFNGNLINTIHNVGRPCPPKCPQGERN